MDNIEFRSVGQIAKALATAQAEMQNPSFDGQNPHFKSKFASLAAVRNAVVPVLAKNGISVTQDLRTSERGMSCITILSHESGEQLVFGPLEIPVAKWDAWALGSAGTYARRYSLQAVACVVGDEDEDGVGAVGKSMQNDPRPDVSAITPEQVEPYINRVADIMAADIDEDELNEAIFRVHQELATKPELYTAVADALAAKKIIGKGPWKQAITDYRTRGKAA